MGEPAVMPLGGGRAAWFSARAPEGSAANEDAAALVPVDAGSCILAVADGLGGPPAGDRAAAVAVESLAAALAPEARSGSLLRNAILNGFENANRAIRELSVGAATTLAVAEVQEDQVRPYHVGDSAILVVGQRGRVKLQTLDHSPVAFAVAAGMLDEEDALHHRDRHVVSNVLGVSDMRIEVGSAVHLASRDTLVLASDGIVDNLHTEEIVECVRKGSLERAADALASAARQRMLDPQPGAPSKPDDLTFLLFRLA